MVVAKMSKKVLEEVLQKQIYEYLDTKPPVVYFKNWAGANGSYGKGVPDIFVSYHGYFLTIETKRPDGKGVITPIQKRKNAELRESGAITVFASKLRTVQMVCDYLDDVDLSDYSDDELSLLTHCGHAQEPEIYKNEKLEGIW